MTLPSVETQLATLDLTLKALTKSFDAFAQEVRTDKANLASREFVSNAITQAVAQLNRENDKKHDQMRADFNQYTESVKYPIKGMYFLGAAILIAATGIAIKIIFNQQ